jgi:hypothetical protein
VNETKLRLKQRNINKIFRSNLAGICFLKYNSRHLKEEILEFARQGAGKFVQQPVLPEHQELRL